MKAECYGAAVCSFHTEQNFKDNLWVPEISLDAVLIHLVNVVSPSPEQVSNVPMPVSCVVCVLWLGWKPGME